MFLDNIFMGIDIELRKILFGIKCLVGIKFPVGISIDVTYKCNLKCKHCYFLQQNHQNELDDKSLLNEIKKVKKRYKSIVHASWVGGEPLLRKNVVKEGMKNFPLNMIVTNGSIELPKWKNCVFNVSVDGTKKYYEKIRGLKIYEIVKQNADRNDIHVNVACVLNKKNYRCIEDLLKEWKKTRVKGIIFDFYTPIKGIKEDLWINWKERDKIIDKLLRLKKIYGSFILNSEPVLELMKSKNSRKISQNCILQRAVISLDPMGNQKLPCVMGDKADCSRCGCVVPFYIESIMVKKQIKSFFSARKLFS